MDTIYVTAAKRHFKMPEFAALLGHKLDDPSRGQVCQPSRRRIMNNRARDITRCQRHIVDGQAALLPPGGGAAR